MIVEARSNARHVATRHPGYFRKRLEIGPCAICRPSASFCNRPCVWIFGFLFNVSFPVLLNAVPFPNGAEIDKLRCPKRICLDLVIASYPLIIDSNTNGTETKLVLLELLKLLGTL